MPINLNPLIQIIERLRGPDGCPWDRAQTTTTMVPALLEELYEVIEAIENQDGPNLQEELGDMLFVLLLTSHISQSEGLIQQDAVVNEICDKMVRRHPHVFGDAELSLSEVRQNWADIKAKEKTRASRLDGIPENLPALQKASRLGQKAAGVGFDWPDYMPVLEQVELELAELKAAIQNQDANEITHEIGDVLLSMASLSRHLKVDPEGALRKANRRFTERFQHMEQSAKNDSRQLSELTPQELEMQWVEAKAYLQRQKDTQS
ncbi:MAG: nucleoside triphosphate pyrophosphohydrolase [Myxococcota bacterium]